jgi:hypothetical protein
MTGEPRPGQLKYKVTTPEEPPMPKRVHMPPPPKPRRRHWDTVFRVVIALVILVSVPVAYWSFFEWMLPLQRQAQGMVSKVAKMSEQTDQAERRWTPEQVRQIHAQYQEVYHGLFADQAALDGWLRQVKSEAGPLALELNVALGQSTPHEVFTNELEIVPASISIEVGPAPGQSNVKSPYERVLGFTRQLAKYGKRADLAELTVTGGVGSVSRAVLVFNLWAGDLGAELDVPVSTTNAIPAAK